MHAKYTSQNSVHNKTTAISITLNNFIFSQFSVSK